MPAFERVLRRWTLFGLLAFCSPLSAVQNAPPNPLGQPLLDASGDVREDAFIRIPLRPEDARYGDIRGESLKRMLLEVDAISLADRDAGNLFWGRNVGTAGHEATQDWVEGYFRESGLEEVHRQAFDLRPQWNPRSWEVTFASGGGAFTLESARPPQGAASTPAGGLEFELVWVGMGSNADYLGRDVRGRAVDSRHTTAGYAPALATHRRRGGARVRKRCRGRGHRVRHLGQFCGLAADRR